VAKITLIAVALTFASFQDLRTREIDDRVWYIAIITGAVLTAFEVLTTPGYPLLIAGISVVLTTAVALGIGYIGLYGGADVKALIAVAVTMPLSPYASTTPFYPFTVLGNGLILSLLLVPACLLWNAAFFIRTGRKSLFEGIRATMAQKFVAFLTGVKVRPATVSTVHFNLMEKVSADGEHVLKFFPEEGPKLIDPNPRSGSGSRTVWATPAIPMIVFFLAGFLLSFVAGDIIFRAASLVLGAA